MNNKQPSWLTQTGRVLALAGSMVAAEANAQEPGNPPPENPPATQEYVDRIVELLKNVRVTDDQKRLEGLRELEKVLEKERPTCQLILDTRYEILATLTIQKLEEKIFSTDEIESEEAANELAETWLKDDNFYLREQARKILDKKYKDNPNNDPRHQLPNTSQYIDPLLKIAPVKNLDEWTQSKEVQSVLQLIEDKLQQLEYEPSFAVRQQISQELTVALIRMRKLVHPIPKEILDTLTPKFNKNNWTRDWQSLEKRRRATDILKNVQQASYTESKLPAMTTTVDQLITDISQHFQVNITLSDNVSLNTVDTSIEILQGKNSYSDILAALCKTTNTYPVCNGHIRNITLVKRESAEGPHGMVLPLDSAAAVFTEGEKGEKDTIQLFMDPQLALLSIQKASCINFPYKETNVLLQQGPETKWNVHHSGWKKPNRTVDIERQADNEQPDSITITAWIATNSNTSTIQPDRGIISDHGPHNYHLAVEQSEDEKYFLAPLHMSIYEYLDWSETPHESDTKTYAAAEATQVTFYRKDGSIIPSERGDIYIDKRHGSIPFALWEKPASADVTTYRHINQQEITFPLNGDTLRTKIIEPQIELTSYDDG